MKAGARTTVFLTVGKTVPLLVLVGVGVFAIDWSRVFPVPAPDPGRLPAAALLVLYAYAGFEAVSAPAGEFRDPKRNLPFALLMQLVIVTGLYTLVQLVAIGTVPDLGHSKTPLSDAGRQLLGPAGGFLLTLGAALSVLGTNNGSILAGPRYLYALTQSGRLPLAFAKIHPRYRTPHVAILTQSGIALALIEADAVIHTVQPGAFGVAEDLALISVIARLMTYLGTCLAIPVLRRKLPNTPRSISLPGGPLIPLAATAICVLLLTAVETKVFIAGAIALAAGALVYGWPRKRPAPASPG